MNRYHHAADHSSLPWHLALLAVSLWLGACSGAAPEPLGISTPGPGSSGTVPTPTPSSKAPTATRWLLRTPTPTKLSTAAPIATATPWTPKTPTAFATPLPTDRSPDAIPLMTPGESVVVSEIHMIDASNGWAIGGPSILEQIHILRTADGGETWEDVSPPEAAAQLARPRPATVYFLDSAAAWVMFERLSVLNPPSVLASWRTRDGGESWSQSAPLPPLLTDSLPPSSLEFVHPDVGWMIVGSKRPSLLRTQNGGIDWIPLELRRQPNNQFMTLCDNHARVNFYDDQDGWMLRRCADPALPELYKSTNGGFDWQNIPLPSPQDQLSPSHPAISCQDESPTLFRPDMGTLAFTCQDDAGWRGGLLYHTQDNGQTWQIFPYPGGSLRFLDENVGWALGREIHRTTDGGRTWTKLKTVNWDGQFSFVDADHAWAVARAGEEISLVRTEDGGRTWKELHPTVAWVDFAFRGLSMIDASNGWAIVSISDNDPGVYRTDDGGRSWSGEQLSLTALAQAAPSTRIPVDNGFVIFTDSEHGWRRKYGRGEGMFKCPGAGLFRTTDGGDHWEELPFPAGWECAPMDMDFEPSGNGIMTITTFGPVGDGSPAVFLTSDGGQTWELFEPPIPTGPYDSNLCETAFPMQVTASEARFVMSCFRHDNEGVSYLRAAYLFRSVDHGRTWQSLPLPLPATSSGEGHRRSWWVTFLRDASHVGWTAVVDRDTTYYGVAGIKTALYQTFDSGRTWTYQSSILWDGDLSSYFEFGAGEGPMAFHFVDKLHGWALSRWSEPTSPRLLRTKDGGRTWERLN